MSSIYETTIGRGNTEEHPAVIKDLVGKAGMQEIEGSIYGSEIYGISGIRLSDFLKALESEREPIDIEVFTSVRSLETTSLIGSRNNPPKFIITDGEVKVDPPEQPSSIVERYLRPPRQVTFSESSYVAWISSKETDEGEKYTYHVQTSKSATGAKKEIEGGSSLSFSYTRWS